MKIIAIEREVSGDRAANFSRYAEAEARRVWELIQEDKIREIYFRKDRDCAVILLECQDLEDAKRLLNTLPFVKEELIQFDLIPLKPYPGLERLFREFD
jgi:hypothetical protein